MARLLGRESVSSDVAALFELIKNAYDADAEKVDISFENFASKNKKNARIIIKDNGHGMNIDSIENKWMVIGTDDKERHPLTKYKKRRVIGNKGIGRFATEKLCKTVTIISKPYRINEKIKLVIDWDEYEKDSVTFNDILNPIEIESREEEKDIGITLILERLREEWTTQKINRLRLALGSLVLPKELAEIKSDTFEVNLFADEFEGLESPKIQSVLLKNAPYKIVATIPENSHTGKVIVRQEGNIVLDERADFSDVIMENGEKWIPFGKCKLTIYFFPGQSKYENWTKYYRKALSINSVYQALSDLHGVKVYRDNFWVRPYGELNDDWLSLEGERVQANYKIGNSQIIGFVQISKDGNPLILDTTTRERLVENNGFHSMRTFVKEAIDSMSYYRKELNRKLKEKHTKKEHQNLISSDIKHMTNMINTSSLLVEDRKKFKSVIKDIATTFNDYERTSEDEIEILESTQRSYRNLASLGISSATTAHEIKQVIGHLGAIPEKIMNKLKKNTEIKQLVVEDLETANEKINTIRHYMNFIIHFVESLSSENELKREKEKINVSYEIRKFLEDFEGIMQRNETSITVKIVPENFSIYIHRADFSSMILNLFTNSLKAVQKLPGGVKRKIKITITKDSKNFKVKFSDNGNGINPINAEKIFRVFYTTNKQGTGLGLPIIKELLENYGGKIELSGNSELEEGATFYITIPVGELKK